MVKCRQTSGTPAVLTVKETAELLRVSLPTVYSQLRSGELPSVRIGVQLRVPRAALLRFIDPKAA